MPINWWSGVAGNLRGAWGTFQSFAARNASTSEIWDNLKALADTGQISLQGIGIQQVNTMRQLAGQWLSARDNLQRLQNGSIPTGSTIFTPPWSVTSDNPAIQTQYRLRVNLGFNRVGSPDETLQTFGTFDLVGPMVQKGDLLEQVLFGIYDPATRYKMGLPAEPVENVNILDYSLEAV